MKRLRKPKLKDGELMMYWGREAPGERPDIIFAWQGDSEMRRDTAFLHYALATQKPDLHTTPLFSKMNPSFLEELEARGYDLTTLRFSIKKKETNDAMEELAQQAQDLRMGYE